MAERSLRGSRLGALSMETEDNVVPSERQITTYLCPSGHVIELPFSVEAEIPPTWECRCGAVAKLKDGGFSYLVMSVQDIEKFRKRSKSPDYGPWVTDYDAMAKKTVIKQLAKYLPLSTEIQTQIVQDEVTKKEYEDVFEAADETDWVDISQQEPEPTKYEQATE